MIDIKDIYAGAEKLINQLIIKESADQGHYLTGAMDRSLDAKIKGSAKVRILEGEAVEYMRYVNDGVKAESASFKQAPFLIRYFQQRGYSEDEATSFAFATIKKWMKEGMSTQASKRFSKTGSRQHLVESALTGGDEKINSYMSSSLDFSIDEHYHLTKSETV